MKLRHEPSGAKLRERLGLVFCLRENSPELLDFVSWT
jgi:hypothetical protein